MATSDYHKRYWQAYKQKKRRVTITLSSSEYAKVKLRSQEAKRKVGEQIWLESQAYLTSGSVPTLKMEKELTAAVRILRGIGNNINQMTLNSNVFYKLVKNRDVMAQLKRLENAITDYVRSIERRS